MTREKEIERVKQLSTCLFHMTVISYHLIWCVTYDIFFFSITIADFDYIHNKKKNPEVLINRQIQIRRAHSLF